MSRAMAEVEQASKRTGSGKILSDVTSAYRELKMVHTEYMNALKTGDASQQSYWQGRKAAAEGMISTLKAQASTVESTDKNFQAIEDTIKRMGNEVDVFGKKLEQNKMDKFAKDSASYLKEAKTAFSDLTAAQTQYSKAVKIGDESSARYWQERIDASKIELANIEGALPSLRVDEQTRQKILDIIYKSKAAQQGLNEETKKGPTLVEGMAKSWDKVYNTIRLITGLSFVKLFKDAFDYAMKFDKAIVDIAVVTQQSAKSAREMGSMYRDLAEDLNVTSVDLATAAATVYRQGYTDNREVSDIITGATKFGAVSDLTTEESIKSMTASLQNFREEGESAQEIVERIGDTWSYMGDAVATEGADIATAMGKASASVKSVGLEFERSSAYAAILLARTQQTGEVIGTQLNSLASRYAKVTSTGYKKITSDDDGEALSFNDISKSLKEAGVEMYDIVNKTFMPLSEVLDELAPKWGTLDEATQKYIATAMAGTRGMNYFLTLMENHNKALELEDQAKANRGTVNEKYEIWAQGAAAAQNNLTNSLEEFYSVLNANTIVDFYNGLAQVVDVINSATDATNGWNIKLPLMYAGIMTAVSGIAKLVGVLKTLKTAGNIMTALSGKVGLVAGGIGAAMTIGGAIIGAVNNAKAEAERIQELKDSLEVSKNEVNKWQSLSTAIEDLGESGDDAAGYHEEFNRIRKEIVAASPDLQDAYGKEGEKIGDLAEAASLATEKLAELNAQQKLSLIDLVDSNKKDYAESFRKIVGDEIDAESIRTTWEGYSMFAGDDILGAEYWLRDVGKHIDLSDSSLKSLYEYRDILSGIVSGDDFKELVANGDSNAKAIEDFFNKLNLTITAKTAELSEQKDVLSNILYGMVYSDSRMSNAFEGDQLKLAQAINGFVQGAMEGISPEDMYPVFENYMALLAKAMSGAWGKEDIDMAEAISQRLFEAGRDTTLIDEHINQYMKAYDEAWLASLRAFDSGSGTDVGGIFMGMLDRGEVSANIVEAFNAAAESLDANGIVQLIANIVNGTFEIAEAADKAADSTAGLSAEMKELMDVVAPATAAQKAFSELAEGGTLSAKTAEDLLEEYPELSDELVKFANNAMDAAEMMEALAEAQEAKAASEWADNIAKSLKSIESAESGTKDYADAMKELGAALGGGFGGLDSISLAQANLDDLRAAADGSADAFIRLQNAAFVNVFGTSSVDFSNIMNGIALVGEDANKLGALLASLGMFTIETQKLTSAQEILQVAADGLGGFTTQTVHLDGSYQILKPAAGNPFSGAKFSGGKSSGKSGGGGGGGKKSGGGSGGGSSISVSEKTANMLDGMEKTTEAFEHRKDIMELRKEYHDIRGEIQGVIAYTEEESKIIEEQNKTLEKNVVKLEAEIAAKKKIMDSNKSSSKAYKQAEVDLDELNEAHKDYTKALLENKNRLQEIQKEMRELREEARQAAISVQDLIRETIETQKEYDREILDSTINLEDTILDVLTERYEKEQELLIETAEAKKEAIQEEIDAIDELIAARKKLIETEEKENEIAELEAKIARISADPTRKKELLKLQDELAQKRKDMAWESYEEEMNAQKESLEDQITNLDDYIEYVNDYYEELFKNPKKLLEEMQEIIKMSDDEIIKWLSDNWEEFGSYSENKKEQTIQDWQEMIDGMRGITETYRDQISEIMTWTDEEIVKWLKENNVEFQNATKEQQESFIDSWKKTLEEWRSAYKKVSADVSTNQYSSGSSSGSGSGSGGGSSSGGGTKSGSSSISGTSSAKSYSGKAGFQYKKPGGKWSGTISSQLISKSSQADATNRAIAEAFSLAKSSAINAWKNSTLSDATKNVALNYINKATASKGLTYFKRMYKTGGLAYETGPAWLDGTSAKPERVLSAYQTQLFEDLIATLHTIKTLNINGIRSVAMPNVGRGETPFTIEHISVHVDALNDDADYELMAEKVGDVLKREIMKSMPTGGLII